MAFSEIPVGELNLSFADAFSRYSAFGYYGFTADDYKEFLIAESNGLYIFRVSPSDYDTLVDVFNLTVQSGAAVKFAYIICSNSPIAFTIYSNNPDYGIRYRVTTPHTFNNNNYYLWSIAKITTHTGSLIASGIYDIGAQSINNGLIECGIRPISTTYPITYHYVNSTVSGPSEAAAGDTVTVSAVPNVDYGITDPTTQISVTNNDDPVNFTWDAATNTITFTMPDPT